MAHTLTTCTFCGVGCGLYLETSEGRVSGVYPSMSHPTNEGRICLRGWNAHEVASSPDRLKRPLLRSGSGFQEVSWDTALDFVASRLGAIRAAHGADALGFLNSPRCSNEESYLLQKLARGVIGTNNVDHGTGVYCNNSIQVLLEMLGVPATTSAIGDLSQSEVIIVDGVDLGRQLPTIGGRVIRAKLKGAKLVVIDSRRHRVAESADYFLQLKPGTDVWLYGAMAKVIIDRGLMNLPFIKAHCEQYESFLREAQQYDLLACAETCGVAPDLIETAALAFARAKAGALLYSTGIEARERPSIRALVNLVLLTGQLGKPGAGLFALTEHNNLQGVCDMGMLPDRLPGYEPVASSAARAALGALWQSTVPAQPGLKAREILTDRGKDKIKALWLCRYDPVSTAFFGDAARALQGLDLLVVQHVFMTDSAQHAHVVLPTTAFGEEQVTFTSTDRRIQLANQVIAAPQGPTAAWQQIASVASRLGADWRYGSAAEVMDEIGQAVYFYGGANYANLQRDYGRQWPCPKDKPLGTRSLFEEGFGKRRFRFVPVAKPAAPESASAEYPLALAFGHSLYYWHQNVLVKHSETLKREYHILLLDYPNGFVEINDADARAYGIRDGERIRLKAAAGAATTWARVTPEVRAGTIFVPFFVREVERQVCGGERARTGARSHLWNVRVEKA